MYHFPNVFNVSKVSNTTHTCFGYFLMYENCTDVNIVRQPHSCEFFKRLNVRKPCFTNIQILKKNRNFPRKSHFSKMQVSFLPRIVLCLKRIHLRTFLARVEITYTTTILQRLIGWLFERRKLHAWIGKISSGIDPRAKFLWNVNRIIYSFNYSMGHLKIRVRMYLLISHT